jgi:hypothetical protein
MLAGRMACGWLFLSVRGVRAQTFEFLSCWIDLAIW